MAAGLRSLADLAQREIGAASRAAATRAGFGVAIGVLVTAAFGFLVAAATIALAASFGPATASLIMAGVFLAAVGLALIFARRDRRRRIDSADRLRVRRQQALRSFGTETAMSQVFGLLGAGWRTRRFLAPLAAAVALGWMAERRRRVR